MSVLDAGADAADHHPDGQSGEEPVVDDDRAVLAQNQMILKLVRSETISGAEWGAYLLAGFGAGWCFGGWRPVVISTSAWRFPPEGGSPPRCWFKALISARSRRCG
jgi:hypothetical protein